MLRLYPLRFEPIFRRYLWGGRRLNSLLGKAIGGGDDYAESWEVVDHGEDQSRVRFGPLRGATLGQLVRERGSELLGRHAPQDSFPLLFKYLDANRLLSVQVHPNDPQAARLTPPDRGKTEAWFILHADPGSYLYAGLRSGCDRADLARELRAGRGEACLHRISPRAGDCLFIPAGVVHALGPGLVVAEIQQSSDTTFRLFDWGRLGSDGKPRSLHLEQGLAVLDERLGPIQPQVPGPTRRPFAELLVACDQFVLERWRFDRPVHWEASGECLIVSVLDGSLSIDGDPAPAPLRLAETTLLPASCGNVRFDPIPRADLLVARLP